VNRDNFCSKNLVRGWQFATSIMGENFKPKVTFGVIYISIPFILISNLKQFAWSFSLRSVGRLPRFSDANADSFDRPACCCAVTNLSKIFWILLFMYNKPNATSVIMGLTHFHDRRLPSQPASFQISPHAHAPPHDDHQVCLENGNNQTKHQLHKV
jgi:hypothetical protein